MTRKIVCAAGIALALAACGTRGPERATAVAAAESANTGTATGVATGATTSPGEVDLGRSSRGAAEVRTLPGDDRRRGRSARRDRDRGARTAQSRREPRDERDRAYMGGGMVDTGGATASPRPGFNMAPSIAGGGGPFETQPPIGSLSPTPMPLR